MNFEQEFHAAFGDKYNYLHLKSVAVRKSDGRCTITFLYPSSCEDISAESRKEIFEFIKSELNLENLDLRVKFLKVYLEEKLILKAIMEFFEEKYKLVNTYLQEDNCKINITPIDVVVDIELSSRLQKFFQEHSIQSELSKVLKDNFLVDFVVNTVENPNIIDETDIENVEMRSAVKVTKRFKVEVVKEVVGKDFMTRPEYLSYIKAPKANVVVAGFINKIERKEFIMKKGKHAGEPKAYFNFQIQDKKGKMDCIYFCPKKNEKVMDTLEEFMFVLLHGDVRLNTMGKLCLYVNKIALASMLEEEEKPKPVREYTGHVVEIEKIAAMEQDTMFGQVNKYNNKIKGKTIVVFDIETTGLDSENDQIIELGAVKIVDGNIMEKFSTFVKPTKRIPDAVVELTGINQSMVDDAPPIEFVIRDFYDFTRGCVISGHNVIGFDIKFIRREGENVGLTFDNELIDTMNEARTSRLRISRFNLGTVVKALGLTLEGAHRAWNDAYATAQVLLKLNEI